MFGRKKAPVVGAHSNQSFARKYVPVPGAQTQLPSPIKWRSDTSVGRFGRDAHMTLIDESLQAYWVTKDAWERLALLGRLYFLCDFFQKDLTRTDQIANAHRAGAVHGLYVTVVDKLCQAFDCSVNFLPQMLEECWGRILTPHGHEIDTQLTKTGGIPTVAKYLSDAKREKYRVRFVGGRAEMHKRKDAANWITADTTAIGWTYHPSITDQMMEPGYAGFALSMSRDFYCAHHRGGFDEKNFFHSSYMGGAAVLCTGTWLIQGGVVKAIKNDSGHYQPTIEHLANVIETLQMHGVQPGTVKVTAVAYSWSDMHGNRGTTDLVLDGARLLARRSEEQIWRRRAHLNQVNIAARDTPKGAIAPLPPNKLPLNGGLPAAPQPPPIPPRR